MSCGAPVKIADRSPLDGKRQQATHSHFTCKLPPLLAHYSWPRHGRAEEPAKLALTADANLRVVKRHAARWCPVRALHLRLPDMLLPACSKPM